MKFLDLSKKDLWMFIVVSNGIWLTYVSLCLYQIYPGSIKNHPLYFQIGLAMIFSIPLFVLAKKIFRTGDFRRK